jgi:hypothetical protein
VFGSRSRVSDAVNGKRAVTKAQAKRLGQLFNLSQAAFTGCVYLSGRTLSPGNAFLLPARCGILY